MFDMAATILVLVHVVSKILTRVILSSVGRNHDKRLTFASVLVGRRRKGTQSEPEATAERERNASDSIDPTAKKLRFPFDAIKSNAPTARGFYLELRETRPQICHIIRSSKLGRSSSLESSSLCTKTSIRAQKFHLTNCTVYELSLFPA